MNKDGLTDERYTQMMKFWDNDEETVASIVEEWGVETCNKGYGIFDWNNTGLLGIEQITEIGAFEEDEEKAVQQAIKDGIKIIPIEELPLNMSEEERMFRWIDTEENRKNILEYCNA